MCRHYIPRAAQVVTRDRAKAGCASPCPVPFERKSLSPHDLIGWDVSWVPFISNSSIISNNGGAHIWHRDTYGLGVFNNKSVMFTVCCPKPAFVSSSTLFGVFQPRLALKASTGSRRGSRYYSKNSRVCQSRGL